METAARRLQGTVELRVLLIEDDLDTQANLRDILELDGYTVETAATVAQTLIDRDWGSLFAIIVDRRLPDGDADSFLPKLRELAPRAAVIVVTGNADLETAVGAIRHGIADFIPKPVDPDMLRASLARTARLREVEERARQDERLATIGRMMMSVAHESRNSLQRIRAATDLLELSVQDDAEALQDVERIRNAASNLQSLLDEIRSYAAPIHLHRETVDLERVWQTAWDHLPDTPKKRAANLTIHCTTDHLNIRGDSFRLQQVFRNLFENSLAACGPESRIALRVSETTHNNLNYVRVIVEDNGPGIPAALKRQLFEPFFTTKAEGTGLGLSIVQRIIEAHGGRISFGDTSFVETAPASLTAATASLPAAGRSQMQAAAAGNGTQVIFDLPRGGEDR